MLVALPAGAVAQVGDPDSDPTAAQYESPSSGEQPESGQGAGAGAEDGSGDEVTEVLTAGGGDPGGGGGSGTLPFTGFDAGVMAGVALLLGGLGLTLRRLSSVQ